MKTPVEGPLAPKTEIAAELQLSLEEQARLLRTGELSAEVLTERYLAQISRTDSQVFSYLTTCADKAREAARNLDIARKNGSLADSGPLCGIPYGLKDIYVTRDIPTSCGSRMLESWIPPYDGTHRARLSQNGAILLGKQRMDEFAMGSSNENSPFEPTRNPWDFARVPGGSSGGSAASVAARSCSFALGSDTGGSIRQPAAFCGIVGLKPSYGRVSRHGMIAYASSLDQAGPMTQSVRDAAIVLQAIAGPDPKDATCWDAPVPDFLAACDAPMAGKRIGVHRAALDRDGMDPALAQRFCENLKELEALGAQIVDIDLPHFEYAVAAYYVLATAEASSNLARYDGLRYGYSAQASNLLEQYEQTRSEGFGAEVKRRIMLGTFVLRADSYEEYYGRAMKVRTLIVQDYEQAFAKCDVIATPPSPVLPFRRGERVENPLAMYLADIFTVGVNLAGLPALSVPAGYLESDGHPLPVGLQLVGPRAGESSILGVAAAYEQEHPWYRSRIAPGAIV